MREESLEIAKDPKTWLDPKTQQRLSCRALHDGANQALMDRVRARGVRGGINVVLKRKPSAYRTGATARWDDNAVDIAIIITKRSKGSKQGGVVLLFELKMSTPRPEDHRRQIKGSLP